MFEKLDPAPPTGLYRHVALLRDILYSTEIWRLGKFGVI